MSESLRNFDIAINDAQELLKCYDLLNSSDPKSAPEVLKRATLIMILTAWETYVEDIAKSLFERKFEILRGSQVNTFIENQFNLRMKIFHTPDSKKTKQLFDDFFGIDVTKGWVWSNYQKPENVCAVLNRWIKKRGEAVHRAQTDMTKPHIIKRDELVKCSRFFTELAFATDKTLEACYL